jgi:hypothetical protein
MENKFTPFAQMIKAAFEFDLHKIHIECMLSVGYKSGLEYGSCSQHLLSSLPKLTFRRVFLPLSV